MGEVAAEGVRLTDGVTVGVGDVVVTRHNQRALVTGRGWVCYAGTAHRAQGRTVDTAHAYVSAATALEPLYVMATRGRESNRLYVDTTYDPDLATSHQDVTPADPVEVLAGVIRTSGADLSATGVRHAEEEVAHADWGLLAQGGAVLDVYRRRRSADERQAEQPLLSPRSWWNSRRPQAVMAAARCTRAGCGPSRIGEGPWD